MREKVGKSRNTVFFQWFVAPEGRKVGSLERRVRSHLARWEMKKCTPLWHEAHFEVKMYKAHQRRTTFGSWDAEKVHAVVARSTFRSQHVQNTTCSRHLWRFRCRFAWQAQGIVDLVRSEQNVRVLSHFQKPWQAWGIWRGSAKMHFLWQAQYKKTCSWEMLGGQGADFLRGVAFWSIRSVGLLRWFLRDRCSTSYDLASIFRGRRSTLDRWSGKIARRIGKRLSALRLTFHFWRKSCRIALFLMLSSSKIEEVSQNCFVLDVVKFKNCRRLVDLFRFWCCQRRKMKKPRRIA